MGGFDPPRRGAGRPETTAAGGRLFVRQFTLVSNHRALSPICQVFSYPQHKGTNGTPLNIERILEGMNATDRPAATAPSESHPGHNGAGDMSPLLVRPMPPWKRSIDMILGSAALLIFTPLFLAVGLAIRISDGGPILFRQRR